MFNAALKVSFFFYKYLIMYVLNAALNSNSIGKNLFKKIHFKVNNFTCLVFISASYNELTLKDEQSKVVVVIIRLWFTIRSLSF